jgi:hypothetical protein
LIESRRPVLNAGCPPAAGPSAAPDITWLESEGLLTRRYSITGFAIEDIETIDLDVLEQHVSALRYLGFPIAHQLRISQP